MGLKTGAALAGLAAALLAGACGGGEEDRSRSVRGEVAEVFDGGSSLSVHHETIPDFMEAMTMTFPVAEAGQAGELRPGDKIRFDLTVFGGSVAISAIEKLPPGTVLELGPKGPDSP